MPGIIPDALTGGISWEDLSVEYASRPPEPFNIQCAYLALPTDCSARIMPGQINAMVSEMLNLAGCFNPDGSWDCEATNNLCTNWTAYRTEVTNGVNLFTDIQALLCGATENVEELPAGASMLWCDGEGEVKTSPFPDIGNLLCELAEPDPEPPADAGYLWCDGGGNIHTSPIVIPDPGEGGLSHGITGTVTVPAANRTIDASTVPPFDLQTINIPNSSTETIKVAVYLGLDADFIELTPGAQGTISFSRFENADGSGAIIMDTHIGIRNLNTGGTPIFSIKPSAFRIFDIPPGGLAMHFGFSGGATPSDSFRIENCDGEVRVYGVYAATFDTF